MRVITLRPGEAPKFNDIPALLDTTEAVQHFCGGDICENRIGSSGIFAITSGEISPEDMPISCMIPEMDMLLGRSWSAGAAAMSLQQCMRTI